MTALQQAMNMIRAQLSLPTNPSDWTYEQRLAYNQALAVYVQNNSTSFSAEELAIAQGVSSENATALDDTGFLSELSDFGGAVEDNLLAAGDKIAGIGNGVLDFAGMLKWIIPVAGLTIVGILLYKFSKK